MNNNPWLFRIEAQAHQSNASEGCVILPQNATTVIGTALSLAFVTAAAFVLTFGTYASRQTVGGYLVPQVGLIKVFPQRPGVAQIVDVREGSMVESGQRIALISTEQKLDGANGTQTEILAEVRKEIDRSVESLQQEEQITNSEMTRLKARLVGLRTQLRHLQDEIEAAVEQKEGAEIVLNKLTRLQERGYVTEPEVQQRKEHVLGLKREIVSLQRSILEVSNSIADLYLQLRQLPIEAAQKKAALENQLSELRRQQAAAEADRSYPIIAPSTGTVTAIQIEPGKLVHPSMPVLAIIDPKSALEAQLLVPSSAIGFVVIGQNVRLRYAAYPYQKYGVYRGYISAISQSTLRPEEWAFPTSSTEPVYRVIVQLYRQTVHARGAEIALQAGMLLEADILQERRPLWMWALEPVLALRGRI